MLARQARRAILPNRQSRPWGELSPETLSMNDVWKVLKVSDDVNDSPELDGTGRKFRVRLSSELKVLSRASLASSPLRWCSRCSLQVPWTASVPCSVPMCASSRTVSTLATGPISVSQRTWRRSVPGPSPT